MSALSIRTRLTFWYSGLLLVMLAATGALSYSWLAVPDPVLRGRDAALVFTPS